MSANIIMDPDGSGFFRVDVPTDAPDRDVKLADRINAAVQGLKASTRKGDELMGPVLRLRDAAKIGLVAPDSEKEGNFEIAEKAVAAIEQAIAQVAPGAAPAPDAPPTSAAGIYKVDASRDPNARDLMLQMRDIRPAQVPAEQMTLQAAIFDTLLTLKVIFPERKDGKPDENFAEYRPRLIDIARLGLSGPVAFPELATRSLDALRAEIVAREAGRVKNGYMGKLGRRALGGAVLALAVFGCFEADLLPDPHKYRYFAILWAGCMLGTWLSFGARRVLLRFEDLGRLEADRLNPAMRLLFSGFLTMVLGLVFTTGMVNVGIGKLLTDNITSQLPVALLVGIFCGLSEQALPGVVSQRAVQFFSEVEKRSAPPAPPQQNPS